MTIDTILDAAAIQAFQRNGAVLLRGLVSDAWRAKLAAVCARGQDLATDPGTHYTDPTFGLAVAKPVRSETFVKDNNWKVDDDMRDFIQQSPLADVARLAMGSREVRLYEDLIICKGAGSDQPTPWHQDDGQWPMLGLQMCGIWFCLEEATQATGSLRFAAGSHRGPLYNPYMPPGREADRENFEGGELPDVDADPARFPVIGIDVAPGDAILFHPRVLHAAYGSSRTHQRRSFSFRFVGDDVRWKSRRNVYYRYLLDIPLKDGDRLADPWFPLLRGAETGATV
ncbi:MAG TPA: phytanoyl-CoA dioxygenase family protein [Burkholderiaceae bacterium]|nr:phytanoyl-CoA dioxygenase family protein [Burkholderiaceae bacterium]